MSDMLQELKEYSQINVTNRVSISCEWRNVGKTTMETGNGLEISCCVSGIPTSNTGSEHYDVQFTVAVTLIVDKILLADNPFFTNNRS